MKRLLRRILFSGGELHCPVCEHRVRRFLASGVRRRSGAKCPLCGSRERHRLTWTFFKEHTNLFDRSPKRMLHVAPERTFARKLGSVAGLDYLTADLVDPDAMVRLDVTDIPYPADSFDVICCSHVLEHVPDDRRAMREFFRVLAPGGWAVLNVPISADRTVEDPSVVDPAERERRFGQRDHVRRYGPDYRQRLQEAGFTTRVITAPELVGPDEARRLGIATPAAGEIFFCTK